MASAILVPVISEKVAFFIPVHQCIGIWFGEHGTVDPLIAQDDLYVFRGSPQHERGVGMLPGDDDSPRARRSAAKVMGDFNHQGITSSDHDGAFFGQHVVGDVQVSVEDFGDDAGRVAFRHGVRRRVFDDLQRELDIIGLAGP